MNGEWGVRHHLVRLARCYDWAAVGLEAVLGRDRLTTKYLCNVRLFSVEVIVIDAQAAQPGGAVERQGGN